MEHYQQKILLDGEWRLYIAENRDCKDWADEIYEESELIEKGLTAIPGSVPGNFEIDMQRAGLIGDLFYDIKALEAQKLENRHLWYATEFTAPKKNDDWYFLFEGVDTVAEYYLNGEYLDSTDNMLISHKIATDGEIKRGKNQLLVHIIPTMIAVRERHFEAGITAIQPYNAASLTMRKAASMFGWDIMPRIVSGGIWRSVYLCLDKPERINDVYLFNRRKDCINEIFAYFSTTVEGDFIQEYFIDIEGVCGEHTFSYTKRLFNTEDAVGFMVDNPALWWPRSMGEPNLYDVTVTLRHGEDTVDTKTFRHGIRSVELIKTDYITDDGEGDFKFLVNGEPFFAMGTNWVPLDALHSRDAQRLPKALELLDQSGSNMVRCWGGNVYEDHPFFDFCDEKGIMVWQDFGMGCALYPFDTDFQEMLDYEVSEVVINLRRHPSIALWAGDNEVDSFIGLHRDPSCNLLTREVILKAIERLDPARPYLPSSPYCSQKAYLDGKLNETPEAHLWGPRQYYKQDFYRNAVCRFVSETGYHGCNSPESIKKFIAPENVWPWADNPAWLVHSASMEINFSSAYAYRIPLMASHLKILFGTSVPDNLEDFALASQISQSEAKKYFIERFRTNKWQRTGILWWNLLDGWPQFSDAVVDYNYFRKLAYFTISRLQIPTAVMFRDPTQSEGMLELVAANERLESREITYKVTDFATGEVLIEGSAEVGANCSQKLCEIPAIAHQTMLLIEYTVNGEAHKNHYLTGAPEYDYAQVRDWLRAAGLLQVEGFENY